MECRRRILEDSFVGQPKEPDPELLEGPLALGVSSGSLRIEVYTAIQLDGELQLEAEEVDHERADGVLTSEFQAVKAAVPEPTPDQDLRGG